MDLSKRVKRTLLTVGGLAAVLLLGLWVVDAVTPSPVRQALPATATDVQEYCNASWQGDSLRCLQAKMPQAEMPKFAAKLGLVERYNPRTDAALPISFDGGREADWWHSPTTMNGAYFEYKPGKEAYSLATYQNGRAYYLATAWQRFSMAKRYRAV